MRPQPSLHRVLDDLGATLLDLVCAPSGSGSDEIGGVAIHDPVDEPVLPRRALVLGVGVQAASDIAALLVALGKHEAAGLVLRSPVPNFSIARQAVVEQYYIRMYDGATPPNYSRYSSAVFVNLPL